MDIKQCALHDIEICSICFFQVPRVFFSKQSHLMGMHKLLKSHPQRTIQSAVMILYLFPTCSTTVPSIYLFQFLRIICILSSIECLIKDWVFTKLKCNFLAYLLILYERIILFPFSSKQSHSVGGGDVLGPKQQYINKHVLLYLQAVLFFTGDFLDSCPRPEGF